MVAAITCIGCAPVPLPPVLGELEGVRASAAATEARRYAPDALARAERLSAEADVAFKAHDIAGAQLIGERAIAAYAHAHAIARRVRAEAQGAESAASLATTQADLATLDAEQARAASEADALETRLRVSRDALPITPSGRASPERERARGAAALALATQAHLLCGAARLLLASGPATSPAAAPSASPPGDVKPEALVDEAEAGLAKVEGELSGTWTVAPIDGATRARAACLAALTQVRRARTTTAKATGISDALLAALAATGKLDPARDDRGVAITLRGVFSGASLSPAGEAKLAELGRVAAAHATFPVEIVVHSDRPVSAREEPNEKARADAAVRALLRTAGSQVHAIGVSAGDKTPVADPRGPDRARNARVEVIFVTPETF